MVHYSVEEEKIVTIFQLYLRIKVMWLDQNCHMALEFKLVVRVVRVTRAAGRVARVTRATRVCPILIVDRIMYQYYRPACMAICTYMWHSMPTAFSACIASPK